MYHMSAHSFSNAIHKSVVFTSMSNHSPQTTETSTIHNITPVLVTAPAHGEANTMFEWDNGSSEDPIGFVTFGSRRFNISLEINIAEILWSLIQVFFEKNWMETNALIRVVAELLRAF